MEEPQSEALVPATETGMAVPVGSMSISIDLSRIPLPRLKITYGVGNLAKDFTPGDLILGEDNLLVHKGEDLEFIPVFLHQYFKEYLTNDQYQSGLKPRTFASAEEAVANGGVVDWGGPVKPTFSAAVDVRMLIKKPDDITCGMFSLELPDGGSYAPAVLTLDKTGYRRAGEGLISTCAFALGGNTLAGQFALSTKMEPINNNITTVPKVKLLRRTDEDMQVAIRKLFNG